MRRAKSGVIVCVAPLLLALANPFDLTGREFLVLFPCIVGDRGNRCPLSSILATSERGLFERGTYAVPGRMFGRRNSWSRASRHRVARRSQLIEIGRLKTGGLGVRDYRLKNLHGLPSGAEELEQRILAASNTSDGCHLGDALKAAEPAAEKIHHRLQAWGLLMPTDTITASQFIPFLIMLGATFIWDR